MIMAITREVSSGMAACELTYLPRASIDLDLARRQHAEYIHALTELGCQVVVLPDLPELPDSVFVEDVAIVLDEMAVVTRPAPRSRRGEVAAIEAELGKHRTLRSIQAPGTLEGGDVLRIGKLIFVGNSGRTNAEGIAQLRKMVAVHGYEVNPVELHGCLHLKSAVTQVGEGTLLYNPAWIGAEEFRAFRLLQVDPGESFAANALLVGKHLVYPTSFPRTQERLASAELDIDIATLDLSELQKAEGAVTCCSLIFETTDRKSI